MVLGLDLPSMLCRLSCLLLLVVCVDCRGVFTGKASPHNREEARRRSRAQTQSARSSSSSRCTWSNEEYVIENGEVITLTSPHYGDPNEDIYLGGCYCNVTAGGDDEVLEFWTDHAVDPGMDADMYVYEHIHFYSNLFLVDRGMHRMAASDVIGIEYYNWRSRPRSAYKLKIRAISKNIAALPAGPSICSSAGALEIQLDDSSWHKIYSPGWVTDLSLPSVPSDCFSIWRVQAPPNMGMQMRFDFLNLSESEDCQLDYIEYRINTRGYASRQTFRLCWIPEQEDMEVEIEKFGQALFLLRTSQNSSAIGFTLNFRAFTLVGPPDSSSCTDTITLSPGDVFFSPGANEDGYPPFTCQRWEISSSDDSVITVDFEEFYLEWHPDCALDALEAYTVHEDGSMDLIDRLCGGLHYFSTTLQSATSRMVLILTTDESEGWGFYAYIRGGSNHDCPAGYTPCDTGDQCILSSYWCDIIVDCYDRSDELNCGNITDTTTPHSNSCGEMTLLSDGHSFQSFGYPEDYPNSHCEEWSILVNEGQGVYVHFSSFYTEWYYDYVYIYGTYGNTEVELYRLHGRYMDIDLPSDTHNVTIRFETDYSVTAAGFVGYVFAGEPAEPVQPTPIDTTDYPWVTDVDDCEHFDVLEEGDVFHSRNFPENYTNNHCEEWLVTVDESKVAVVHFSTFRTEEVFDYLEVFDPHTNNPTPVYSGHMDGLTIVAESDELHMSFRTDGSVTDVGYNGTIQAILWEDRHYCYPQTDIVELGDGDEVSVENDISADNDTDSSGRGHFCNQWMVIVEPSMLAAFLMDSSSTLYSCNEQSVEFYSVNDGRTEPLGRHCERSAQLKYASNSSRMLIKYSGAHQPREALRGTARAVIHNIDTHTCGGRQMFSNEGEVTLETNPTTGLYYPNSECHFLFESPEGTILKFTLSVNIEGGQNCRYDSLVFYNGDDFGEAVMHRLCGESGEVVLYSRRNVTLAVFTSDYWLQYSGFTVRYEIADPNDVSWLTCGVPTVQPRVVGGRPATPSSIPWQVAIVWRGDWEPLCGASIIDETTIVTAAHCTEDVPDDGIEFLVGMHDWTDEASHASVQRLTAAEIIIHEEYHNLGDGNEYNHDIAVIRLADSIVFSDSVAPICLPDREPEEGEMCIISGWGQLTYWDAGPNQLYMVEAPVLDRELCSNFDEDFDETMICQGNFPEGGVGACHGDSGGPVACFDTRTQHWVLSGVVSWGHAPCAGEETYSAQTNVHYFLDFINQHRRARR